MVATKIIGIAAIVSVAVLAGCSNQSMHEAIQHGERMDCMELPESQYKKCLEETSESYGQYKRKVRSLQEDTD